MPTKKTPAKKTAKKTAVVAKAPEKKDLHDKLESFAILAATAMFNGIDTAWKWTMNRWDKWLGVAILIVLMIVGYFLGNVAVAGMAFFFAAGYGLGWFCNQIKNRRL